MKGLNDPLEKIPLSNGVLPGDPFPTISDLLNIFPLCLHARKRSHWTAKRVLDIVKFYDPEYETEDEDSEYLSWKRIRAISKNLGLTSPQVKLLYTDFAEKN